MQAFDPGCCCDPAPPDPCILFSDTFNRADDTDPGADYVEDVAGVEISGNRLAITTSGARVLSAADLPTSEARLVVSFTIASGKSARVYFCWLDSSNHFLASITTSSFLLNAVGQSITESVAVAITPDAVNTLELCFVDGKLIGHLNGLQNVLHSVSAPGFKFGFGSGIAPAYFDDLTITEVSEDCDDCAYEPEMSECDCCEDGTAYKRIGFEIAGVANGPTPPNACDECDTLNGLWMPFDDFGCGGLWDSTFDSDVPTSWCSVGDLRNRWFLNLCGTKTRLEIQQDPSGGGTYSTIVVWEYDHGTSPIDCSTLDGLVLPMVYAVNADDCGGFVGSTVTVRLDP